MPSRRARHQAGGRDADGAEHADRGVHAVRDEACASRSRRPRAARRPASSSAPSSSLTSPRFISGPAASRIASTRALSAVSASSSSRVSSPVRADVAARMTHAAACRCRCSVTSIAVDRVDARCRSGSSAPQRRAGGVAEVERDRAAVPGTPSIARRRHSRRRRPGVAPCATATCAGVDHVDARPCVLSPRGRDQAALDGERADPGEDVAAVLASVTTRPGRRRPAGTGSRRRRRRASERETTATLLVSGSAPPMPSIWRGSGEPMTASRTGVARGRVGGQVARRGSRRPSTCRRASQCRGLPSEHRHLRQLRSRVDERSPLPRAWRACRRCRGRARRPRGARASSPPCASRVCAASRAPRRRLARGTTHDAVVVGDDHVAGLIDRAGADDRHVHRAEGLLDRALRGDRPRPDREAHLGQVAHVAHAGVDDQAAHAARHRASVASSSPK